MENRKGTIAAIFMLLLLVGGLIAATLVVRQQINTGSKAADDKVSLVFNKSGQTAITTAENHATLDIIPALGSNPIKVSAVHLVLKYDPAKLIINNVSPGDLVTKNFDPGKMKMLNIIDTGTPGTVTIDLGAPCTIKEPFVCYPLVAPGGTIVNFTLKGSSASLSYDSSSVVAGIDTSGNPISRNVTDGQVRTLNISASTPSTGSTITKKVQLLIFNPVLKNHNGQRLITYKGWNNPDTLTSQIISDLKEVSGGKVNIQVVERHEIDDFGVKADGFKYTEDAYLNCLGSSGTCHQPDGVDYLKILATYQSCEKRNRGEIDEVWLWGGPYFGYYESTLAGPNAFWYNSPPLEKTTCQKLLPIMGFNYERGISEALEDLGHRTESAMEHVEGNWVINGPISWDKFIMVDKNTPGQAECGSIHYAPNSLTDYDWSNKRVVKSACDDWLKYPNLPSPPNYKDINCDLWNCDGYQYKKWWFKHLPGAWWKYVFDYESGSTLTGQPVQVQPAPPTISGFSLPATLDQLRRRLGLRE